jgi:xanthine dehydrogenase YagR molybdenum-binding subunit
VARVHHAVQPANSNRATIRPLGVKQVSTRVHDIKVIFVDEPDDIINPLGIKDLGEIGIVGVAAAVANAVYHATGKPVRDLPITLDKLRR